MFGNSKSHSYGRSNSYTEGHSYTDDYSTTMDQTLTTNIAHSFNNNTSVTIGVTAYFSLTYGQKICCCQTTSTFNYYPICMWLRRRKGTKIFYLLNISFINSYS